MSYSVEELFPSACSFTVDGESFQISPITLQKTVEIIKKFGSLAKMFEKLGEDPKLIIDIMWLLLLDKTPFKNLEVFKNHCLGSKESIVKWSFSMSQALQENITSSMPLIKNHKRYKEIQEISGSQEEGKTCYLAYFDAVASRYGWDLEKFYSLTMRQLHMILKQIGDSKYEELEVQASLAGKKLKPRIKYEDISEEQEAAHEKDAQAALKRLQEEYRKKQNGK